MIFHHSYLMPFKTVLFQLKKITTHTDTHTHTHPFMRCKSPVQYFTYVFQSLAALSLQYLNTCPVSNVQIYIVAYSTLITHNRSHLLRSSDTRASTTPTWWKNELYWLCVVSFVWRRQNTSNSYWVLVQVNFICVMEYPKIISSSGLVFLSYYATVQLCSIFSVHICFYRIKSSSQSELLFSSVLLSLTFFFKLLPPQYITLCLCIFLCAIKLI